MILVKTSDHHGTRQFLPATPELLASVSRSNGNLSATEVERALRCGRVIGTIFSTYRIATPEQVVEVTAAVEVIAQLAQAVELLTPCDTLPYRIQVAEWAEEAAAIALVEAAKAHLDAFEHLQGLRAVRAQQRQDTAEREATTQTVA